MKAIANLDMKTSYFFDHHNPKLLNGWEAEKLTYSVTDKS